MARIALSDVNTEKAMKNLDTLLRVFEITKKETEAILRAFTECVFDNLADNKTEKIPLPGVGSFSVKHVAEKSGVAALAGGKAWSVPEHDEIKFSITKSVKTLA